MGNLAMLTSSKEWLTKVRIRILFFNNLKLLGSKDNNKQQHTYNHQFKFT